MIDNRTVQVFLKSKGAYEGSLDAIIGPKCFTAMKVVLLNADIFLSRAWPNSRLRIATEQLMMTLANIDVGEIDGISGPRYLYGIELYQNYLRDVNLPNEAVAHQPPVWPRQKDIRDFYGEPGQHQVRLMSPYPLFLDWDMTVQTKSFLIHEKCHDSALRAMKAILSFYGEEKIHILGLDQFGGCLNVRLMRGGTSLSMHSWGCAIDWDANRNTLRMNHKNAQFARTEYIAFLDAWEDEGWISLGRERDFDWMHLQAARL